MISPVSCSKSDSFIVAVKGFRYTFRTSNFGSARGGAGVSDKGFASMELARAYMDVFTASLQQFPV
ncbi:hypothetical protein EQU24_17480 [Methylotuvimicrobium buryatense]|uniref:Uncharacterized protein n=1 Tax=Methylotuvimicrobium buryatense TaxID=95641 RepID=A0A4P9UQV2_METBY|nr:hypothetical protein EQU24_17480 [Methylotuvimicrobium buryatense]